MTGQGEITIKAALFDMDGLLIDSERIYTLTTERILAQHGMPPVFPMSVKSQMMGRPGPEAARIFLDWSGVDLTVEEYMAAQRALQTDLFPRVALLPGVADLLAGLKRQGIVMAVATSSMASNYALKRQNLGAVFDLFEGRVICGDDARVVGKGKPDPEIFKCALREVNAYRSSRGEQDILPEECLVLEDGIPGVTAGLAAGNHVLWVPDKEILALHEHEVDRILGDRGRMIMSLEDFPWADYGLVKA